MLCFIVPWPTPSGNPPSPPGAIPRENRRVRWERQAPAKAGMALILLGIAISFAWTLQPLVGSRFTSLLLVPIADAIGFVLLGVALIAILDRSQHQPLTLIINMSALVLLLIGLTKLVEPMKVFELGRWFSGSMWHHSANSAINFIMLGAAFLLLDFRRGRILSQLLIAIVGWTSLLSIIGFIYGERHFYGTGSDTVMPFASSAAFLLAAAGMLYARPDRGFMSVVTDSGGGGMLARRLLAAAIAAPLFLGWFRLLGQYVGFYSVEFGTSFMVLMNMLILTLFIWWSADSLIHAERQRQRAEEDRHRFFALSLDLLSISSINGRHQQLNHAWERTLGFTIEELMAEPWVHFVHPEDRTATLAKLDEACLHDGHISFENRFRCRDHSYRWMLWSAHVMPDAGLIYAAGKDITERKHNHEKTLELNSILLQKAQELASANSELEAFSYTVSHDLRAPLRNLHGYVQLLRRKFTPVMEKELGDFVGQILDSARQMNKLIEDLLAFSRLGRTALKITSVDLAALVHEFQKSIPAEARARQIEWQIDPLPRISADPDFLRLALANLLENALKYTRPREVARIHVGTLTSPTGESIIFIRDNGVGFEMKYATKLFGVFQRLHTADEFEGTGIGLANVQRIIQRHGGRIWTEAVLNQGATFFFSLPNSRNVRSTSQLLPPRPPKSSEITAQKIVS